MAEAAEYRRLRAPQDDGQTLVEPPRPMLGGVIARNRMHLASLVYDVQGRSLAELAASARRSLVDQALAHTSRYRDVSPRHREAARTGGPLILSGHQPQLFHAGVWYKNFVLGDVAEEVGGAAVHLLIDSDLCRAASIRVPTGSVAEPRLESVPFDAPAGDVPYEERFVQDEATFARFSDQVSQRLRPLVADPLVETLWPLMPTGTSGERKLGLRVAQGRHRLEAEMGNDTLELPQSCVCTLAEFHWFVAHLLAHLPRFWAAYNDALAAYRHAHRLRTHIHPVPDLAQSDGWLEAPFWMWTADEPRRQPVFARQRADSIELTDRHAQKILLTLSADRDAEVAAEQLAAAAARGIKLRTRALATTLFARLLVSDLFLHGIGGAKYDQVTDDVAQRFFGFSLPDHATASATLRLPVARATRRHDSVRAVRQQLRELAYHPERLLTQSGAPATALAAVGEKTRWLATAKTPQNAGIRHQAISGANAALQPFVAPQRERLESEVVEIERRLAIDFILNSREYSFCLFPREHFERLLRK
ncbi:MAG: hypothetical protein WD971_09380 [Pirellulales bacterium]